MAAHAEGQQKGEHFSRALVRLEELVAPACPLAELLEDEAPLVAAQTEAVEVPSPTAPSLAWEDAAALWPSGDLAAVPVSLRPGASEAVVSLRGPISAAVACHLTQQVCSEAEVPASEHLCPLAIPLR